MKEICEYKKNRDSICRRMGTKGGICDCNMGKWGTENYQGHGHTAGKKVTGRGGI